MQNLCCFVQKVSNVAISYFLVFFFANFGILCYVLPFFCTIWVFWAFYAVLSQIKFVVIHALFWVNLFWLKLCSCKKSCLFPSLCIAFQKVKGQWLWLLPLVTGDRERATCNMQYVTCKTIFVFVFWIF